MSTTQQPEAMRLAEQLRDMCSQFKTPSHERGVVNGAIQELRRQHARIAELEAQLSAIVADGVEPLRKRAATAYPTEGVPEQAGTYAEARECEHCNHVGINDAANGIASCTACKWNGDSPKEDKCPDCEAEGTMTASCPKCHHEYRLIADATLAATQPAAQVELANCKGDKWLTVVYRDIQPGDESRTIVEHPKVSALSWSHALHDRDAALAAQAKQGEKE